MCPTFVVLGLQTRLLFNVTCDYRNPSGYGEGVNRRSYIHYLSTYSIYDLSSCPVIGLLFYRPTIFRKKMTTNYMYCSNYSRNTTWKDNFPKICLFDSHNADSKTLHIFEWKKSKFSNWDSVLYTSTSIYTVANLSQIPIFFYFQYVQYWYTKVR